MATGPALTIKPSLRSAAPPALHVTRQRIHTSAARHTTIMALPNDESRHDETLLTSRPSVEDNGEGASFPLPALEENKPSFSGRDTDQDTRPFPYGILCALGSLGLAETLYLTVVKLAGSAPVCLAGGSCTSVLNSPYGNIAGVPLPAMGMLAYGSVALLSGLGLANAVTGSDERQLQDGLICGSAVLISTSAVLMYVLATRLGGEPCPWCLASAGLSTGIAATGFSGFTLQQLRDRVAPLAAGTSAAVILALGAAFSGIPAEAASTYAIPYNKPAITSHSSDTAVALAKKLKDAGAKMYGAFWCSHCNAQKDYFGQEAMADFPYVECFPEGLYRYEDGSGTAIDKACSDIGVKGFPTWVINGQKYEGEQTFEDLDKALSAN